MRTVPKESVPKESNIKSTLEDTAAVITQGLSVKIFYNILFSFRGAFAFDKRVNLLPGQPFEGPRFVGVDVAAELILNIPFLLIQDQVDQEEVFLQVLIGYSCPKQPEPQEFVETIRGGHPVKIHA